MALADTIKGLGRTISAHSPAILTGIGVAGVVTTAIMAVKATPDALARVYVDTEAKGDELTPLEVVKSAWICYIPTAIMGGITITCIVSSTSISARRQATLLGLYTITEAGYREYEEKVKAHMGATKEQKVRDDIAKDTIDRTPVSSREVILIGNGNVLCFDTLTSRYFTSDMQTIQKAVNDLNRQILTSSGHGSQNEFYTMIGLPRVALGDEIGWDTDNPLEIDFTTQISDEEERPCLVLNYRVYPVGSYADTFRR